MRLDFSCGVGASFAGRVDGESGGEVGGEGTLETLDSDGPIMRRVG